MSRPAHAQNPRQRWLPAFGVAILANAAMIAIFGPWLRSERAADEAWTGTQWASDTEMALLEPDREVNPNATMVLFSIDDSDPAPEPAEVADADFIAATDHVAERDSVNPDDFVEEQAAVSAPPRRTERTQRRAEDRERQAPAQQARPVEAEVSQSDEAIAPQPRPSGEGDEDGPAIDLGQFRPTVENTAHLDPRSQGEEPERPRLGRRERQVLRVEEGDRTDLTTARSTYYGWMRRHYSNVEREWRPDRVHAIHDPTGALYGTQDRVSDVRVVYDADGRPARVELIEGCGLAFLDEEAMRTLRSVPLPGNIPEGLRNANGEVHQTWRFTLTFRGGRPGIDAEWLDRL